MCLMRGLESLSKMFPLFFVPRLLPILHLNYVHYKAANVFRICLSDKILTLQFRNQK